MAKSRGLEAGIVYERFPGLYPNTPAGFAGGATISTTTITNAQSPYTVLDSDRMLVVDASAGAVVINLPASQSYWLSRELSIFRTDSTANTVTVNRGGGDTINGATSIQVKGQYSATTLTYTASTVWSARGSVAAGGTGTPSVVGDFALTGWGAGAAVSAVSNWSDDRHGLLTITAGSAASANPTVAHTIPAGRAHAPGVQLTPGASAVPTFDQWIVAAETATLITWQFIGTPTNAQVYHVFWAYQD